MRAKPGGQPSLVVCRVKCCGRAAPARSRRPPARTMASASAHVSFTSMPLPVFTDSYKACHPLMYPDAAKMVAVRARAVRELQCRA
jgi:hypothetical protein